MKRILLTQNKYALVDDKDFGYLNQFKWRYHSSGYAVRTIYHPVKKTIWMHRIINNTPRKMYTDHVNRDKLDNRRCNLRACTNNQNQGNSKIRIDNTSGHRGISWNKRDKKWQARININGKLKHLGYFINIEDAAKTYEEKAKIIFGEFVI